MGSVNKVSLIFIILLLALVFFYLTLWVWGVWHDEWSGYNASVSAQLAYCNVAVAPVVGGIYTDEPSHDGSDYYPVANADDVISIIRNAENNPNIKGVLVSIDSTGGGLVASELIMKAIQQSELPTAALIREYGTSGAYLVATAADIIFASPFSDVGGIGITMSYLENVERNSSEGVRFVSLTSAPFKDYGNPNKSLTNEERELLQRDLDIWQDEFVRLVSKNRGTSLEDIKKLADGSSMPSSLALENGLIDSLGDIEAARSWFADELHLQLDEIIFCSL